MIDPIIQAFEAKYGIKNLLQDLNMRKMHNTGINQMIMCCDFHDEQNESLSMNMKSGLWKCFGCGLEGNLYQFVMRSYNIDYGKAKDFIINRSGLADSNINDILFIRDVHMNLPQEEVVEEIKWHDFQPHEVSLMYESSDPYEYLQKRGFTEETLRYFETGFTSKWRGRDPETQEMRYEPRITIPGHDEYGKIAGFIGRTPIDQTPKYRYTFGYQKSQTIFNLHRAKEHTESGLILVEGSLDTMRVHQFEHPNVGGILGAKLSEEQARLIAKHTDTVYLMYDSDEAGQKAAKHSIEVLHQQVYNVIYIPIPAGLKDPDNISSSQVFDEAFANRMDWFAYTLEKEVNKYGNA